MTAFRYGIVAAFLLSQSVIGVAKAEQGTDQAPDVVVLCDPSLRETLVAAGRAWQAKSRVPVRVLTASLEQNAQLIVHGARADILVGVGVQRIDEAQQLGAIGRGAPTVIGHDPIVLVVRGSVAHRRELAPGDDIGSLLGDGRIGLADPAFGSAGPDARTSLAATGSCRPTRDEGERGRRGRVLVVQNKGVTTFCSSVLRSIHSGTARLERAADLIDDEVLTRNHLRALLRGLKFGRSGTRAGPSDPPAYLSYTDYPSAGSGPHRTGKASIYVNSQIIRSDRDPAGSLFRSPADCREH